MSQTVYFGKISKRRNSTLQPTLTVGFDVVLKSDTSIDYPTFLLSGSSFDYNMAKWDDRYYFVDNVKSVRNGQWEVSCTLDPLATYKSEILASTQFVSYSSQSGGTWLADDRIPLLKSSSVSANSASFSVFNTTGFYTVGVLGNSGSVIWGLTESEIMAVLNDITTYQDSLRNDVISLMPNSGSGLSTEEWLENLCTVLSQTGTLGNAYLDAPNCIRSCIWVPFYVGSFSGGLGTIYLGQYNTGVTQAHWLSSSPATGSISINIPWHYSDWRRSKCEEVYLYLPFAGMVNIPSDEITNQTALTIEYSITATDGNIVYKVNAGNEVICTLGANASANYAIGVSQQSSAGELLNTMVTGASKTVSTAIEGFTSVNPAGMALGVAGTAFESVVTGYKTANTQMTRHNSYIGGIGGGAGSGLSLNAVCYTVSHATAINPADMQATMGLPTMQPMALSSLTGYCQCANAHVAVPAESKILDMIDAYVNSGFYIE